MNGNASAIGAMVALAVLGCSSSRSNPGSGNPGGSSQAATDGGVPTEPSASASSSGGGGTFAEDASFGSSTPDAGTDAPSTPPGTILAVIRDFRFYDAGDPSTDPDFENIPTSGAMTANGYDDKDIVADTLGTDGKPVYKNPTGTTETTHGRAPFDAWYRDTSGTNIHVDYPLPLTANADGSSGYDSQTAGVPYNVSGQTGDGFFPIDDGTNYQTAFGNQGEPHNYSFTVEIHTVFTYRGGEYFNFRGDDDVFVFINQKLVINLGGVHSPEPGTVMVDSLGLAQGQTYPLDFFSAERHVTGSNIEFETTLDLQPPPAR